MPLPDGMQIDFTNTDHLQFFRDAAKAFGENYGEGYKNDPPGSPVGPYGHGTDGLFNIPGTNDAVFSMMQLPMAGALGSIPVLREDLEDTEMFGGESQALDTVLTGVTKGAAEEFDQQPTGDCADGPVGGLTKLCTWVNPYSRYRFGVREVSMVRAGQRLSRVDPRTLRLMNSPLMQQILGVPTNIPSVEAGMSNELARRLWETGVSVRRFMGKRVWIGSPANNNGQARDIVGLDLHINKNNKVDYKAMAVCTAANSDIYDFGYDLVSGNGRDIVAYIEMAEDMSFFKAEQQGLAPVVGKVYMRPELWREISAVWPIRQFQTMLTQMALFNQGRVVVSANEAQSDRDAFRRLMYLPVNGRVYQVVTDNSMRLKSPTDNASITPGQYSGDIVFVPFEVLGGVPVTFFEPFDHDNAQEASIQSLAGGSMTFTSDGGLYRWYVNFKNGCLRLNFEFSVRLKVKTPQLGWRINNVKFQPLSKLIDPDPDSEYFADGGVINQDTDDEFYTSWSPTTKVAIT